MSTTREASLHWVTARLELVLPEVSRPQLEEHAEALVLIAEQHSVPMEMLIEWIDRKETGKLWAATEWRRFCELYSAIIRHRPEAV